MYKTLVLALIAVAAQDAKPVALWKGAVSAERADAFPGGITKSTLHFGLVNDGDAWAKCWKRIGQEAPAVDFKKHTVLFFCHEKWPATMAIGKAVVEKGVMTIAVALDDEGTCEEEKPTETPAEGDGMRSAAPRCHYDYQMQALARADLKKIRIVCGDKLLGEIAL